MTIVGQASEQYCKTSGIKMFSFSCLQLSIIEEDLEIKIEIQSIKEQFLNLLHFYDNYEASGDKWSGNVAAVPGRKLAERDRGSYRLHLRRSLAVPCPGEPELQDLNFNIASPENGLHRARPALYTTAPTENSKPSSMSTGAHAMGGESSIDVDADTSVEVKAGPAKDFKQKQKGSKFPTTDSNVDDQEESKAPERHQPDSKMFRLQLQASVKQRSHRTLQQYLERDASG